MEPLQAKAEWPAAGLMDAWLANPIFLSNSTGLTQPIVECLRIVL